MYHENDPGVSADSVSCGFSVRIAGNLATCRKVAEKSGSFSVTFLKAKKNVLPIWHSPFLLFGWIPKEGSDLSFGAGSSAQKRGILRSRRHEQRNSGTEFEDRLGLAGSTLLIGKK